MAQACALTEGAFGAWTDGKAAKPYLRALGHERLSAAFPLDPNATRAATVLADAGLKAMLCAWIEERYGAGGD
ncbi:hypothetical protein [uncultured Sphingomonas sp.]|uniref:hypothetical protein n=1 Tax=uncultured Sphingomonas sp. TaxID=158754 RepID=UPI0025FD2E60|nr:hypothetical protein [uncultured Sphingomonas sp.]